VFPRGFELIADHAEMQQLCEVADYVECGQFPARWPPNTPHNVSS
jgi:hypothetical protein